ncbi:carboxylesterase family protein [Streptomyces violascens]|uniref:carboxylesterase family protein n=1 Tax=Streptomyces violascens TaxID=67381 RepID=UPI00368A272E
MTSRATRRSTVLALALTVAALCAQLLTAAAAPAAPAPVRPVVTTGHGRLAGQPHDDAEEFLGIPYAAPPVGNRRFRPPESPAHWSGTRDAVHQAPACTQFSPFGLRDPQDTSEDCLYLDVYRPRTTRPGDRLPVLFWMHGGAYSQGTGTQFGGRTMAGLTRTIVVSVNYRLGRLGYLAVPELTRDNALGSGSYGLMDQLAALGWTRDNIRAFGGDPAGVTIWGQRLGLCDARVPARGGPVLESHPAERALHPDPRAQRRPAGRRGPGVRGRGGLPRRRYEGRVPPRTLPRPAQCGFWAGLPTPNPLARL